jgi:restriction system protein
VTSGSSLTGLRSHWRLGHAQGTIALMGVHPEPKPYNFVEDPVLPSSSADGPSFPIGDSKVAAQTAAHMAHATHNLEVHLIAVANVTARLSSTIAPFSKSTPSIVLQALVELGEKTSDGHRIALVAPAWFEIIRLIERDPNAIFGIPPRKLEELIAGAYERSGFDQVTLTPRSGDFGRDVIAEKTGWGSVRFIDQVKAYKPDHLVTAEEVRALGFVLLSDRSANKGIVTTTSDFAPRITQDPFISPHLPNRIELINGTDLVQRLQALTGAGSFQGNGDKKTSSKT